MVDPGHGQKFLVELAETKHNLPYSPSLLSDLYGLTGDKSQASMEDIADIVSRDSGLTAKVLAAANSAYYGLQAQVSSVTRAVTVLGIKELRRIILLLGVNSLSENKELPDHFNLKDHWEHQFRAAVAAKVLAKIIPDTDPDILFTAALLHDIGKLITAVFRPADREAVLKAYRTQNISFNMAEDEYWGLEHGLIGALTLNAWNLPPELTEPVNWHHSPALAPDHKKDAKIISLADSMAYALIEEEVPSTEHTQIIEAEFDLDLQDVLKEYSQALEEENLQGFVASFH